MVVVTLKVTWRHVTVRQADEEAGAPVCCGGRITGRHIPGMHSRQHLSRLLLIRFHQASRWWCRVKGHLEACNGAPGGRGGWCTGVLWGQDNGPSYTWDALSAAPEPAPAYQVSSGVEMVVLVKGHLEACSGAPGGTRASAAGQGTAPHFRNTSRTPAVIC
jgi:hypothetical protein